MKKPEQARLNALKQYRILDTGEDPAFNKLTELASLICETPISLISLIDEERQWFKSRTGLDVKQTPREIAFCTHAIEHDTIFEVEDATKDERFKNNPLVTSDPDIRFYAGYPLIDPDGHALGTLCVIDRKTRSLTAKQKHALKLLAEEAIKLIVEQRQKEELTEFKKIFQQSGDFICVIGADGYLNKQNPAFSRLRGWRDQKEDKTRFFDLIHPEDAENTIHALSLVNLQTATFTNRCLTKDKKQLFIEWVATYETSTGHVFAIGRDITSEHEKEETLKASENRFRAFFENSQGLMCTHDLEGNFITVNFAGAQLLGYTVSEVQSMNLFNLVPEEFHKTLSLYLERITHNGKATGMLNIKHKNGSLKTWMFNNIYEKNPLGEDYIIGNAIDITERHRLEKDLKFTKEMLEQTSKIARIGGWEFDLRQEKLYWSEITRNIHEVPADFVPDITNAINFYKEGWSRNNIAACFENSIRNGIAWDIELQLITAKGREIWVRAMGNAEFEGGKCTRVFGTFQDIDEKKKAEIEIFNSRKQLQDLLQSASEVCIISSGLDGIIRIFNKGAENLLGYTAEEMIDKKTPSVLHDPEEISARARELSEEYNTPIEGIRVFTYKSEINGSEQKEWTYIKKDGTRITVSLVVSCVRDNENKITAYLGVATDITIRKKTEQALIKEQEELRLAKKQAEEASLAKSDFLANMSHEIRTPLNGVIGFTDLLLKTDANETQKQYLSIVNQSGNTLLNIINDILDFSKIEAGKLELDIEKCDVYEIGSQAADIISYQVQQKGLEMLLNISADLPRFIWTDEVRLKQVLINLLGNATKFTETGEIELKIVPLSDPEENEVLIRFEVRDTGIGIKPEKQSKIFEAFLQEDVSTTKKYGGTGLGLTISNKLLHLMGSRLQLNSAPGRGSTFYFDLPLRAEQGQPINWEGAEQIKKVLIVDDNDNNRMILRQMLLLRQITSDEANNGIEALTLLSKGMKYDVIFMDYHMPIMNGLETIRKIRESFYETAQEQAIILLYSSSSDEAVIKACDELDVSYRIVKPIKMKDMFDVLSRLTQTVQHIPDQEAESPPPHTYSDHITVLLVEDNQFNMLLASTIIKRIMPLADIIKTDNGNEAVEYCRMQLPDIILMDVQMPQMNGYEATRMIRQIPADKHIPIIALTAGNIKGEKEKCLEAGMDDFLAKPIIEEMVEAMLNKWLNHTG